MASAQREHSGWPRCCGTRRRRSALPRRASCRRSWKRKRPPWKRTSASCARSLRPTANTLLAADSKHAVKDIWLCNAKDIVQRWRTVRGANDVEDPGPSGLLNMRVAHTQTLLTKAHDVMAAVHAFLQELYIKCSVDLPSFQAVLGCHMPPVPEGARAQVQQ